MTKLIRITTAPIAFKAILKGQLKFLLAHNIIPLMVSNEGSEINEIVKEESCKHIIIPMTRSITPVKDFISVYRMYKLFKAQKPDIIHAQSIKANLVSMIAGKIARVPIRIQTMAGLISTKDNSFKSKIFEKIEKLTFALSTNVWPNSQSSYNHILEKKLCSPKKLQVIGHGSSNGIDLNKFNFLNLDTNEINKIKVEINFNNHYTYLLFVGRVVKDKGIVELVNVFKKLNAINNNLKLILVGPYENDLDPLPENISKELECNNSIIKIGWSNKVEYYMSISHLFVFPSYREGFPNVLLQAGAMKCPIICSNIIGNIDIVDHKISGLLFENANEKSLQSQLEWALQNFEAMKNMTNVLYQKVVTFYDRKKVHQYLLDAYLKLINGK